MPGGVKQFDMVPVTSGSGQTTFFDFWKTELAIGLSIRDVGANSDFVQPRVSFRAQRDGQQIVQILEGKDEGLQLALSAMCRRVGDALRIDGTIRDLSGKDRAVTVYLSHPVDARGWQWHDDQRVSRNIEAGGKYHNYVSIRAGANGMASRYPLACISGEDEALAIGAPLDVPRLYRFAYDADSKELYAAVDLGLSAATEKFASEGSFSFVLYRCDPKWGFRSALQRYYELFPQCFTKRNEKEGIWMPFTDIATVEGFEDFGFQFQEGAPNVAFDEEHGIYSFVYVEPMSHWIAMPKEMERTNERAIAYIKERAGQGRAQSQATLTSAIEDQEGEWSGGCVVAPWCDGAVFHLNPSPNVVRDPPDAMIQFEHEWRKIEGRFESAGQLQGAWGAWEKGYEVVEGEGRNGSSAAKMTRAKDEGSAGASQRVVLKQKEATALIARAWTKTENVSGDPSNNYSLYIDLNYTDGTSGWGFVAEAQTGTHEWQLLEETIVPEKPVASLSYHLLFREPHTGTVWFDDAFLAEQGNEKNLVKQGGFEPAVVDETIKPELDGTYIDSLEMAASSRNYRRAHFAQADTPLVFDSEGRVCQLGIFNTVEFAKEVATRMWGDGKMMFANSTPHRFAWAAAWLDVMGTETNWARDGNYTPNPDATMNYRRAVCYQRPYLLLLNTVYDDFEPEWVELYFKRCAAYGIFPGFFSHNAADDPYWRRPNLYNRDRPLFVKYIPVIKALNGAGWEPVTYARSDNEKVYVERFGRPGGPLYLTVFNDSDEALTAAVTLELESLGLKDGARITEVLSGEGMRASGAPISFAIDAEDVKVLRLSP